MDPCDEMIHKLTDSLPDICTINDLINAGIINHRATMEYYRKKNIGPPFLRLSARKIYYPKDGITRWLKARSYVGEETPKNSGKIKSFPSEPDMA
jgi:hypothetical protein